MASKPKSESLEAIWVRPSDKAEFERRRAEAGHLPQWSLFKNLLELYQYRNPSGTNGPSPDPSSPETLSSPGGTQVPQPEAAP